MVAKILKGNCKVIMKKMIKDGKRFNHIITDPPFGLTKNVVMKSGMDANYNLNNMCRQKWDQDFNTFDWLDYALELLDKNGSLVLFNDWKKIGNISYYLEERGMVLKDLIIWKKNNLVPRVRDRRYHSGLEFIIWFVKKKSKWTFNRRPKIQKFQSSIINSNIITFKEKMNGNGHPTQKTIHIMKELIEIHTNKEDTIFDPFAGSGTTGVACIESGRNFVGIEREDKYVKMAKSRIKNAINKTK